MQRPGLSPLSAERVNHDAQVLTLCFRILCGLTAFCCALVVTNLLAPGWMPGKRGWPETLLLLTATAATGLWMARQLPGQNVLLAGALIGVTGAGLHGLSGATAVPFGPLNYTIWIGSRFLELFPWPVPLLWIVAVLNSRGVARLILRPWRKLKNYGLWLIGLTAVLTMLFDLALEPFLTGKNEFWLWQPTKFPWTWHGMPLVNSFAWLGTTILVLAFATPALIGKKQRPSKSPPDYFPLMLWLALMSVCGVGAATGGLWSAAGFCVAAGVCAGFFAIRGARW